MRIEDLIGQDVVLDVASPYLFIGKLVEVAQRDVVLADADVHDLRDTATTRELYVLETKRHGIRANRARVIVRRDEIVSLSALDDVLE